MLSLLHAVCLKVRVFFSVAVLRNIAVRIFKKDKVYNNLGYAWLGILFRPKRDKVTGEWRKLHNEELNDLYSSPNIVRVIKSRRIRWAGHVVHVGEGRGCTGF